MTIIAVGTAMLKLITSKMETPRKWDDIEEGKNLGSPPFNVPAIGGVGGAFSRHLNSTGNKHEIQFRNAQTFGAAPARYRQDMFISQWKSRLVLAIPGIYMAMLPAHQLDFVTVVKSKYQENQR